MSIKRNIVFLALILESVAAGPSFAQNQKSLNQHPKLTPVEREKTRRTMQDLAMAMARKDGNAWQDISSAPAFPLPLFRGNQTKFAATAAAFFQKSLNSNCKQINIFTRDPAPNVYQFYARNLPASGFVIDTRVPSVVGKSGQVYLLKAESSSAFATVSVTKKDDPSGPGSLTAITVINKPPAPAKK